MNMVETRNREWGLHEISEEAELAGHPHVQYTIERFMLNYEDPFDSLNEEGKEKFKKELRTELSFLIYEVETDKEEV